MKRLIPLVAAGALLAAAPAADAAVELAGGSTQLTLDKRHRGRARRTRRQRRADRHGDRRRARRVRFPISGGAIDPASAAGRIDHRGGLRFSAGGKRDHAQGLHA